MHICERHKANYFMTTQRNIEKEEIVAMDLRGNRVGKLTDKVEETNGSQLRRIHTYAHVYTKV